jgi:hypothetical protein
MYWYFCFPLLFSKGGRISADIIWRGIKEKEKDKKGENIKEKSRKTKHLKFEVKRVK